MSRQINLFFTNLLFCLCMACKLVASLYCEKKIGEAERQRKILTMLPKVGMNFEYECSWDYD